jgi:hypothetical protein
MHNATPPAAFAKSPSSHHACTHAGCDRWGAWGYDPGEGVTAWWCLEHRPDRDPVQPVVEQNWVSDGHEG